MQRHDLIQAILDTAGDAHLIKAQAFDSGEDVIYDNPNTIVLEGGYDCTMENIMPGGMTKIRSLVITKGTLILKHIEIGGA
jgi:hypothetical protein